MHIETIDRIELRTLVCFERVAALGSFAEAGRQLDLPRAAISRIIQQLEDQVGARLFLRTTRQVSLTAEGDALRARLGEPLSGMRSALLEAASPTGAHRGTVSFSVSQAFGRHFVLPALPSFSRLFPEVRVELSLSDGLRDLVAEGLDFTIRMGELPDSSLIARKLAEIEVILAVPRAMLEGRPAPRCLADLEDVPAVGFRVPGTRTLYRWRVEEAGQISVRTPSEAQLIVDSVEDAARLVEAGVGAAPLPRYLLAEALASGEVIDAFPKGRLKPIPVHLCFPHAGTRPRRVQALLGHLETHLRINL
ncbi:MAG: LysR family transcriptional regulator [Pseudomonadota bacterium]